MNIKLNRDGRLMKTKAEDLLKKDHYDKTCFNIKLIYGFDDVSLENRRYYGGLLSIPSVLRSIGAKKIEEYQICGSYDGISIQNIDNYEIYSIEDNPGLLFIFKENSANHLVAVLTGKHSRSWGVYLANYDKQMSSKWEKCKSKHKSKKIRKNLEEKFRVRLEDELNRRENCIQT